MEQNGWACVRMSYCHRISIAQQAKERMSEKQNSDEIIDKIPCK